MTTNRIRQLSMEEMALVCGGSQGSSNSDGGDPYDLPPVEVTPDPGWDEDPVDWNQYDDPWDQPDYGDNGGSGGSANDGDSTTWSIETPA